MAYYTLYREDNGALLGIAAEDEEPLIPEDGQSVKWHRGDIPPLSHFTWDRRMLMFVGKEKREVLITRLAFRNRFTVAEKQAIYTAAQANTDLKIWLDDLLTVTGVSLENPQTIAGVQALEAAGLIGAGRADEILGTLPREDELLG